MEVNELIGPALMAASIVLCDTSALPQPLVLMLIHGIC